MRGYFPYLRALSLVCLFLLFTASGSRAVMLQAPAPQRMKVFYSETDFEGWDAVLKGKIISLGIREDAHKNDLMKIAQDKTKATIRLSDREGIKVGDTLLVINQRNLVVARIEVASIFKSRSFGYLLVGYGNLRLANPEHRVVQRADEEISKYAFIYKSRGDYHNEIGNTGKSISFYKRAIELDRKNPEAHLSLGRIYLEKNLLQFALKEFDAAYKEMRRLYDNEDKYLLLKSMVDARYQGIRYYRLPSSLKETFKKEGIQYCTEALEIYPKSKEIHFLLGMLYFIKPEPSDVKAKNQFLKVIEMDPENVEAYVHLAVLYKKHKNDEKAEYFTKQALERDPANTRARHILKLLREQSVPLP